MYSIFVLKFVLTFVLKWQIFLLTERVIRLLRPR